MSKKKSLEQKTRIVNRAVKRLSDAINSLDELAVLAKEYGDNRERHDLLYNDLVQRMEYWERAEWWKVQS